jgi:hypothetical protein
MKKRKINFFDGIVLPIGSFCPPITYHMKIFHQDMDQNVCFCEMTKYPIYATTPQKWNQIKKIFFHQQHLTNALPTSPQTLSHDHFSPRYDRLRLFTRLPIPSLSSRCLKMKKFKVMFFWFISFLLLIFAKKIIKKSIFFPFFHFFGTFWQHFCPKTSFPRKMNKYVTWIDALV